MDADDASVPETPVAEAGEAETYDKQVAALQSYLDSVPYECESVEEMQAKLEYIIGKLLVCSKAKNWLVLSTWDGLLQCWLLMRYPVPKSTRAKLVKFYYELCLLPGVEARVVRNWADMLTRLLDNKPGSRRKLEATDLQLEWRPLWRVLHKELWPKRRAQDSSRNVVNILLYVAEHCRRYFPASEIPIMLETFVPLVTQDSILTMFPVFTSFLPPFDVHLYLPALFQFWQAFNSSVIDDRMLELLGELAEEHIEGTAEWKDVGMWTEAEWTLIAGKMLGSMNVPVGGTKSSTTSMHADAMGDRQSLRIKKTINRYHSLAKLVIYSMAVDGPVRSDSSPGTPANANLSQPRPAGYTGGSKALDSLDRLITSTESYFHPSNAGPWSIALTTFVQRLVSEFAKRMHEEKLPSCKTPLTRRLTAGLRRIFITILRTPILLAMFSKDPLSMASSQASLHTMALLQPDLIMPEILERAYGGLEVVNETHRTTAVLSTLSLVATPLVSERIWLGGQKHLAPLLELAIPGIDLNDPAKTLCSCMFIVSAVQLVKIGDLSIEQSGIPLSSSDAPAEDLMNVDQDDSARLPDGTETAGQVLSRDEERVLTRESTAGFADWAVSLFRRVFALYENLPEEGGRKQTTGGKQEEAVLKSIKSMLDVVCLHLSDQLFDLILKLVFEYATTNAKANSVRAFGQLVACLARVKPAKTIAKFLPFCLERIEDELRHGASGVRTTSSHAAVPSDTTLHWNMAILRGCLGYGGAELLEHKDSIMRLIKLLVDKTLSERGFSGAGRLITRVLNTLSSTYPINGRYVNEDEWESPEFARNHTLHWGKLYEAKQVKIVWHVPSDPEIAFVLEILDQVTGVALDKVEALLGQSGEWDGIARNDFCRFLQVARSTWSGLGTLWQEQPKTVVNPCIDEKTEIESLLVTPLSVKAGFTLSDPQDPRYQKVLAHRTRFGGILHRASIFLQGEHAGEDHIDAVMAVLKSIDIYMLEYGTTRSTYDSLRRNYGQARDLNRVWARQKTNSRIIFVKRAQVYHSGRLYMNALYRRRSELDDKLLQNLIDFSISGYTRVRRQAQGVLQSVFGYYVRSTRFTLPAMFDALAKGLDPDRMKGALYVLYSKGTAAYAFSDHTFRDRYLLAMLECQHQEKPSIQKLVANLGQEALVHLAEEVINTDAYIADTPSVDAAVRALEEEFGGRVIDQALTEEAKAKGAERYRMRAEMDRRTIEQIIEFASAPTTHWRYILMATRFLSGLLRRDAVVSPNIATFFISQCINPHPTIRAYAQRAIVKLTWFIKIRTYSKTNEALWLEEWHNPLEVSLQVQEPDAFLNSLQSPVEAGTRLVDKLGTGFVAWTPAVKAYAPPQHGAALEWEEESRPALEAMAQVLTQDEFFTTLSQLWSQESSRSGSTTEIRGDNVTFIKSLTKMFGKDKVDPLLSIIDPLVTDPDKYRQRASSEVLAGLLRGSKHWPTEDRDYLWAWAVERIGRVYSQLKPDTLPCWEGFFGHVLEERDPRRSQPLMDWVNSLPLEFHGNSAFDMSKTLTVFGAVLDNLQRRVAPIADKYMNLLFENANTGYAEMRAHIAQNLFVITSELWTPYYPSVQAFLTACGESDDPLRLREAKYNDRLAAIVRKFPEWKEERLPPPRTNQSEYDKVGLALLQWLWISAHGQQAALMFPYTITMLPEVLRMSELNDSSELQTYSSAVLYVISAVSCPPQYLPVILDHFVSAVKSTGAWRIRLNALPTLVVFFYRNLLSITSAQVATIMDALLDCLADENVEVREMASKALSGVVRCSQRQSIIPLKNRFVALAKRARLPSRRDPKYAETLRSLHSAVLGLCALIDSFPYSVEPWMPPLTDVLAAHATDPPPISTTIRNCASEFKKTHQDTWHKDQQAFDEDQLQNLSTMLVGTSYYA